MRRGKFQDFSGIRVRVEVSRDLTLSHVLFYLGQSSTYNLNASLDLSSDLSCLNLLYSSPVSFQNTTGEVMIED